jgi:hypothetical protein
MNHQQLLEHRQDCEGERCEFALVVALEQGGADGLLQFPHGDRDGRLRAEGRGRRALEAAGGRRDHELADLLNLEHRP